MEYFVIYLVIGFTFNIVAYLYDIFFQRHLMVGITLLHIIRDTILNTLFWPLAVIKLLWYTIKPILTKPLFLSNQ